MVWGPSFVLPMNPSPTKSLWAGIRPALHEARRDLGISWKGICPGALRPMAYQPSGLTGAPDWRGSNEMHCGLGRLSGPRGLVAMGGPADAGRLPAQPRPAVAATETAARAGVGCRSAAGL